MKASHSQVRITTRYHFASNNNVQILAVDRFRRCLLKNIGLDNFSRKSLTLKWETRLKLIHQKIYLEPWSVIFPTAENRLFYRLQKDQSEKFSDKSFTTQCWFQRKTNVVNVTIVVRDSTARSVSSTVLYCSWACFTEFINQWCGTLSSWDKYSSN